MEIVNTVFQVLFIIIMSIGILGLPLFFYLNSRKKRIYEEDNENDIPNDSDDINESEAEN